MKRLLTFVLILITLPGWAQPYIEKQTSERFAQTVFGANGTSVLFNNDFVVFNMNGHEKRIDGGTGFAPGITFFSGLHFWGHAEFFVKYQGSTRFHSSFSMDSLTIDYSGKFSSGVETGAKFYPLRIHNRHLSPMIGISWQLVDHHALYKVNGKEYKMPTAFRSMAPVLFGLTYSRRNLLFDAGCTYYYDKMDVPILSYDQDGFGIQKYRQKIARWSIEAGLRFYFDSSVNAEVYRDKLQKREQYLKENGKLSGITYGIGISSMQFLKASPVLAGSVEGFSSKPRSTVFPELSVGYHFQRIETEARITYRGLTNITRASSFNGDYRIKQECVSLEAIKILGKLSYHGFIPFVGTGYSRNFINVSGSSFGNVKKNDGSIPLVFGWDIDVIGHSSFVLRTNLRYNFNRSVIVRGQQLSLDNLEVNFIQATWFPSRKIKNITQ